MKELAAKGSKGKICGEHLIFLVFILAFLPLSWASLDRSALRTMADFTLMETVILVENIRPTEGAIIYQGEPVIIQADIFTNLNLSEVYAEVMLPNSAAQKEILSFVSGTTYEGQFVFTNLPGQYNITFAANDFSGNVNNSEITSFLVSPETFFIGVENIDLTLNSTDIIIGEDRIEGKNATINAAIKNLGNDNATNVIVKFLDDDKELGNTAINISAFSTIIANTTWTAELGPNEITIILDPENLILETDETNNNASRNISTDSHFIFYGKVMGQIGVGLGSDLLFDIKSQILNIFATGSGSNLDFNTLQSLGRKNDSLAASSDFIDADVILNMSNFDDSIANLYSTDGTNPKEVDSFDVFGSMTQNVPIVNSTNSSTFITGILWDVSDDSNGEFDTNDGEDLTFVTKVNPNQKGSFGVYDYEIKVPVLLREHTVGGTSVDLFLEVK